MIRNFIAKQYSLSSVTSFRSASVATRKQTKLPPTGMHLSPYNIFMKDNFAEKSANREDKKLVMKELADQWKQLSVSEKQEYKKRSEDYHEKKVAEFMQLSEESQKKAIESARMEKAERARRKERKERREVWKTTDHPKIPPNAFAIYMKSELEAEKKNGQSIKDMPSFVKAISEKWKTLAANQKKAFQESAKQLNDEYHAKLAQWKLENPETKKDERKRSSSPVKQ